MQKRTGSQPTDAGLAIQKQRESDRVLALAGNPNVGKSTLFNGLTGMKQHTGNWPGKTVSNAQGYCALGKQGYVLVDLPGTYSLMAHSAEEEAARNFLCFGGADAVLVVCDATCLERNLNLVLQTLEISGNVVVCVNLLDEAERKGIQINFSRLSQALGVPVVGCVAREGKKQYAVLQTVEKMLRRESRFRAVPTRYAPAIEEAVSIVEPSVQRAAGGRLNARWLSLALLSPDESLIAEVNAFLERDLLQDAEINRALTAAGALLSACGLDTERLRDEIVAALIRRAEEISQAAVTYTRAAYNTFDRRLDGILTSRRWGYPVMLCLLVLVFWITISGANYPSQLLSAGLFWIQERLTALFSALGAPGWLHGALVLGIYRVAAWVASVMLPPMAIFFPLFTLLEDMGYLPRIAYNLDRPLKRCSACGKQALTMCMGFGCNAVGVSGCRIIDSPRERLLAILTNSFVPCNGRFPGLILILTMFFVSAEGDAGAALQSAVFLTLVIVLSVGMTMAATKLLSKTLLRGVPSSFTLELPPYRRPQVGRVILRSALDRTVFVLGRAVCVAAPAGLILWLMANVQVGEATLLQQCAAFLDPFARQLGLDGVILMAFILGFPANEIVLPIILMAYTAGGSLAELGSAAEVHRLLTENGWTWVTACSVMLFSLMHWPCSTTLLTIKKETGSIKWTMLAAVLPTAFGMLCCFVFSKLAMLLNGIL